MTVLKIKQLIPSRQSTELFNNLLQRELKGKYKRTVFGQLWSLANPVALMLVYTFVFSFVIRISIPAGTENGVHNFPLWLLCGLLPWIFFANSLTQSMGSLIANEALIRKVYFPRSVLIFSSVAAIAVNWLIEMAVLMLAMTIAGATLTFLFLPATLLIMFALALFATGFSLALSIANVYFRDTQHFVAIALQLGMYMTPVVYPLSLVQEQSEKIGPLFGGVTVADIYQLNPLAAFISIFRNLLYDNALPGWSTLLYCLTISALTFAVGLRIFLSKQKNLAEIL